MKKRCPLRSLDWFLLSEGGLQGLNAFFRKVPIKSERSGAHGGLDLAFKQLVQLLLGPEARPQAPLKGQE